MSGNLGFILFSQRPAGHAGGVIAGVGLDRTTPAFDQLTLVSEPLLCVVH